MQTLKKVYQLRQCLIAKGATLDLQAIINKYGVPISQWTLLCQAL